MFRRCKEVTVASVLVLLVVSIIYTENFKFIEDPHILLVVDGQVSNTPNYTPSTDQNTTTEGVIDVTQLAHRQRIDSVCALIKNGTYKIPPTYASAIRRPKGIVDNYHGVLYCDIGKTGTTSWLHFFKIMTANEGQKRRQWFNEHPYSWYSRRPRSKLSKLLELGFNRLSNTSESHREAKDGLPDPREDYFRFIQVRHPLERLASAYFSRVRSSDNDLVRSIRNIIGNMTGKMPDEAISFWEFLTYVAIPDEEMILIGNDHFKTFQTLCEPCEISYDYVARQETLNTDLDQILPKFKSINLKDEFPEKNVNKQAPKSYKTMYHDIPHSILKPVIDKYQADADMFGYAFDEYIKRKQKR